MEKMGKYIYCVIEGEKKQIFTSRNIGKTPSKVFSIHHKNIGAVVSDSPIVSYSIISDNYLAHQRVIEEAMFKNLTPLPVRFGTIAKDEASVLKILEKRDNEFKENLSAMKGKRELGLKVFWNGEIAYNEILQQNENVKKMRDQINALPSEKSYYQRIEIGKLVKDALEEKRDREGEEILSLFKTLCIDYRTNKIIGDKMIINASFLVDENQEHFFDEAVEKFEKANNGRLRINYVGPIPTYNFIEIVIHLAELGLS